MELDLNLVTLDYYDLFGFTSGCIWSLGSVIVRRYENIEITSTDMFVTQRGLPYPIIVPSFPILTSDNRLDYGSKLH